MAGEAWNSIYEKVTLQQLLIIKVLVHNNAKNWLARYEV